MEINLNQLEIPKASAQAAQALEIASSDEADLKALEQVVMKDPLLASTLLRYANSPLNRRSQEITNVPAALRILGLKSVRSAIVTAAIRSMLPAESEVGQLILTHMVRVAAICKVIADHVCPAERDDLEFLGLVHDVGMLTLAANYTREYANVLNEARLGQEPLDELERKHFGVGHDMVSARTAREFRLPQLHIDLLQHFHTHRSLQELSDEQQRDTAVLALAHILLYEIDAGAVPFTERIKESKSQILSALKLNDEHYSAILEAALKTIEPQ
jgi:HD-like signal output (HDOD) protein